MEKCDNKSLPIPIQIALAVIPAIITGLLSGIGAYVTTTNTLKIDLNVIAVKLESVLKENDKLKAKEELQDKGHQELRDDYLQFKAVSEYRLRNCK